MRDLSTRLQLIAFALESGAELAELREKLEELLEEFDLQELEREVMTAIRVAGGEWSV